MKKQNIEELKKIFEANEIESSESLESEELNKIKVSSVKLANAYVNYFVQFKKDFQSRVTNKEILEFIEKNNKVSKALWTIIDQMNGSTNYKQLVYKKDLVEIVVENYDLINEFIDLYVEVYFDDEAY